MESRRKSDSMTCACAVIRKHCGRQNGKVFPFCRHAWNRELPRDWPNRQPTHDHLNARYGMIRQVLQVGIVPQVGMTEALPTNPGSRDRG